MRRAFRKLPIPKTLKTKKKISARETINPWMLFLSSKETVKKRAKNIAKKNRGIRPKVWGSPKKIIAKLPSQRQMLIIKAKIVFFGF